MRRASDKRLLKKLRVIAQHAETVSAMCRRVEREIEGCAALGHSINYNKVENKVRAIESRAMQLTREVGIGP